MRLLVTSLALVSLSLVLPAGAGAALPSTVDTSATGASSRAAERSTASVTEHARAGSEERGVVSRAERAVGALELAGTTVTVVDVVNAGAIELASECSLKCDKEAATCVDTCETTFQDDVPKRVGCKVDCIDKRRDCDAKCK